MDPFSALGAASSIIQFLDFGGKLVGVAHGVYKSSHGLPDEYVELRSVVEQLRSFSATLQSTQVASNAGATPSEQELHQVARVCAEVAKDIIDTLQKLQKQPAGQLKTWHALEQAFKVLYKKEYNLERLQKRLDKARSALVACVLGVLRYALIVPLTPGLGYGVCPTLTFAL
jgi:hypothetical protein